MLPRWAKHPFGASPRAVPRLREQERPPEPGDYRLTPSLVDPERTSTHMISADDAEYPREYRTLGNGTRRFSNVGLVHTSLPALTQVQPNYWSFKTRSSRHSQGSQPGLADQAKLSFASAESLETMSEAELPLGFNRMNRFRQSLPLSRSTSQTKLRSPGVLFLQFGDETRRVHITHEISSMDTLHALIVHMFPQKLTMGMLKSPNTAILIKDESRNVFYELEDVRDIQDRSIIKIYRKEPLYASFPASHITNGDLRREMVYTSRESSPTRRLNNMSPASHLASGSPPPVLQSSSPSRSRMSYSGGRPPSYAGSPVHHGERLSSLPPAQGVSPSPSAILERRDVKPDEDLAGKNVVLVKNEGLYADPYGMVHEGRLSITSTQSLAGMGDPFGYSGGLYKRGSVRSLSTYSAAALQTELEDSLYKPNAPIYSDTYGPGLGFRMPPSSPQKMADGRLVDVQPGQSPHSPYSGPPSRSSPVRQSFRKDSCSSVFMESPVNKPRNPSSSGPPELFPGPGDRPLSGFGSPGPAKDTETRERMEAMEKQIASLTGLVQSALLRGSEAETPSEKTEATNGGTPPSASTSRSGMGTPVPAPPPPSATSTPAGQPTAITRLHMQLHLHDLQQNASDLRNQLQQLKKLQLQNQETVKTMLRRTETEISVRVTDTMRKHEDPLQRQRSLVEEERLRYLNEEELITQQLNDLEKSVEKIQKDLAHNHRLIPVQELEEKAVVLKQLGETLTDLKGEELQNQETVKTMLRRTETEISVRVTDTMRKHEDPLQRQRSLVEEERLRYLNEEELITQQLNDLEKSVEKIQKDLAHNHRLIPVQELEEKAVVLKQLGETLTDLKAQFPSLQSKMRVVLRVEVEAVKFLKEEPNRLDGLLKRCKTVTDTLAQIRSDLEKSVEKIQKDLAHNHRLIPVQELEEKAVVLKQLGETLTDLKAQFPSLQSKMRVVLRVEVEAVKFLKEEPNRLDGLLKRCKTVTDTLAQIRRQVDEGVWTSPSNLSQSPKKVAPETDFSKGLDLEMPTSPPVSLHHLTAATETLGMPSFGHSPPQTQTHPSKSNNPSRAPEMVPAKTQTGPETPSKKSADKAVSVEAAERDWEEKRAALTQYSAKDINRLLEETQAELMKAIPDLEFAAKHKQGTGSGSAASTPEHKPSKPQHAPKSGGKGDPNGRRGSDELTVPRYRTEKPSKSPPPPPPRRSFPSSHGLTTTRSGEVIVTSKKEPGFMKKAESEELETQKPQVKLRRTVSEVVRPASTPPIIASAIKDDDDEDRIIAELEVFQRSSASPFLPKLRYDPLSPGHAALWPNGACVAAEGWKSGGVSIPAMKVVNPASRLKQSQQGSPDKSKHIKQRMEYMRIQGQQQAARPSKEASETSPTVSEKPASGRTSIPVLTSFGARNSSISF
ncbi:PREDICTED: SRC kinase signaling inhibitor 1 [Calidris pugnax]|uniref:SRC kinase signaling inhibitor 1 n=1 Tax=Calidris pugnax TaxID=198806 RepID=UPI00071E2043|nr:PREDICTED: SRC kinase signaling inhibitor 1 [Calidris pugnax]